jgi:hypothetical protein
MSGRILRRFIVLGLTLCLWLLPLASAHAAPHELGAKLTIGDTMQQFGRTILQFVARAFNPPPPPPPPPPPGGSDGMGIDPNGGGFRP